MMPDLDNRLHAYRPDLADVNLRGRIDAKRFVEGVRMEVVVPVTAMHREASSTAMQTTQALFGERLIGIRDQGMTGFGASSSAMGMWATSPKLLSPVI